MEGGKLIRIKNIMGICCWLKLGEKQISLFEKECLFFDANAHVSIINII